MDRKCIVFFWDKIHQEKFLTDEFKYPTFRRFPTLANNTFDYYLAFGKETHKGKGVFSPIFRLVGDELIQYKHDVCADIVMKYDLELEGDKGDTRFIYNPEFNELCKDKFATYKFLNEFSPKTHLCHSKNEFKESVAKMKSSLIVAKPNRGVYVRNVFVFEKSLPIIPSAEDFHEGVVVQEFIDTSVGCRGIVHGMHDLRLSMINDKNIMASVSIPRGNSLVANWHQGATVGEVEVENLPEEITRFRDAIHAKIREKYIHVMYNMDIGVTADGPKLIELNSPIAFPRPDWKCVDSYLSNLIEHLDTLPLVA